MGSMEESVMGYSTALLPLLALVSLLCTPTACECECNGMGAGVDGVHAPCEAQWGQGIEDRREYFGVYYGDIIIGDKRRFCFVDEGVCPDQKKTTNNRFWSHLACYEIPQLREDDEEEEGDGGGPQCDGVNIIRDSASVAVTFLKRRYGGGGSGSWRRPWRKGGRWRLSFTRQSNREK